MSSSSDRHPLLPNHNTAYHTLHVHDTFDRDLSFTTRRSTPFSWFDCLQSTAAWLIYIIALAAFTTSLVLSLTHASTPATHPLPVTMGLIGGTGLLWLLLVPWQQYMEENASPMWEATCCRLAWLTRFACFVTLLTCAIVQSVWVFGSDEEEVRRDVVLYEFAWWFLVCWWSWLAACVLGGCCLCLMCCRAFFLS